MPSLGTIWAELGFRLDQFDQGLRQAESRIREAERRLEGFEKAGERLSRVGKSLTTRVTLPLLAAGGAAVKFAMDAVESENLFEVSMGNMADAARKWSEELSDALGLNEYELRRNIGTFNVMLSSMGMGEEAAYGMAQGLTELAYDMASFYNLKPEEAFEKLQAGISGEIEPLKRLGIVINETTVKAYALKTGMIEQGQEMTEQQKIAARYALIMEQTAKAQGDLARTLDSPANKLRVLKSRAAEVAVDFGMLLLPTFERLVGMVERLMDRIEGAAAWLESLDERTLGIIVTLGLLVAAIGPVLWWLGAMTNGVVALSAAYTGLAASMGAVIALAGNVIFAFQAWAAGAATFGEAMLFIMGPIGWVALAIGALIAVLLAWKNNWGHVRDHTEYIAESIKAAFWRMVAFVGTEWNRLKLEVYEAVGAILDLVAPLARLLPGPWKEGFEEIRKAVDEKVRDINRNLESLAQTTENAVARQQRAFDKFQQSLSGAGQSLGEVAGDMEVVDGWIERMNSRAQAAAREADNFGASLGGTGGGGSGGLAGVVDILEYKLRRLDNALALFQATTQAAEDDVGLLAEKKRILTEKVALVTSHLVKLEAQYKRVVAAHGEYSEAAMDLALRIDDLRIKQAEWTAEINGTVEALNRLTGAGDRLKVAERMGSAAEKSAAFGAKLDAWTKAFQEEIGRYDLKGKSRDEVEAIAAKARAVAGEKTGLPIMHEGGVFRAPRPGGEGLALLRDWEVVLPPGTGPGMDCDRFARALTKAIATVMPEPGSDIHVNVQAGTIVADRLGIRILARSIWDALIEEAERTGQPWPVSAASRR